jgi:hypothetical protein
MMDKGFMCDKCGKWITFPEAIMDTVPIPFRCPPNDGGCGATYTYFAGVATYMGKAKTGGIHPRRSMPRRSGEES